MTEPAEAEIVRDDNPLMLPPSTTVMQAARLMHSGDASAVLVTDGDNRGAHLSIRPRLRPCRASAFSAKAQSLARATKKPGRDCLSGFFRRRAWRP